MTDGRLTMRAKADMSPQGILGGERCGKIPGEPASRSCFKDRDPAIFR